MEHASALKIATEIGTIQRGIFLSQLANMHSTLSKNKEAVASGNRPWCFLRGGRPKNEARVLSNLAGDHLRLGEHERALTSTSKPWRLTRALETENQSFRFLGLAHIQSKHGQWAEPSLKPLPSASPLPIPT